MTVDPYNLDRFVLAQENCYTEVCLELSHGNKTGHWMWFIFPQLKGLGLSSMSRLYAISSLDEALQYSKHALLGMRLRETCNLVLKHKDKSAHEIFGSPDDMKLQSSMTLFSGATHDEVFANVLREFFNGERDKHTLRLLGHS